MQFLNQNDSGRRKLCVITGSRAEYGLLRLLMAKIAHSEEFELQVIVTGSHLSKEFGSTYTEIEDDGFSISQRVEILSESDSAFSVIDAMGLCLKGVGAAIDQLKPDLIIVLGDRYEIFSAVQAAMVAGVPVAHIGGGDVGSGTYDNLIRHCITKMAALHFVTHEDARRRVLQLGEDPEKVFCVGSTCVDNIQTIKVLSRSELEDALGIKFATDLYLITYHPLTMGGEDGRAEVETLLAVLRRIQQEQKVTLVFTKANADNGGRWINSLIERFIEEDSNRYLFDSLGQLKYLSTLLHARLVIGNSSSGIYEAPYLKTATVDIGSRQLGRKAPESVFRVGSNEDAMYETIKKAASFNFDDMAMVYGDGSSSERILLELKKVADYKNLTSKEFFDLKGAIC